MQVIHYNSRQAKPWQIAVREKMKELRITQVEMAEKLGVTQGGIGHWLNDTRKPNVDQINAMLKECHLPPFLVYPVVTKDFDLAVRVPLISWSAIPKAGSKIPRHDWLEGLVTPFSASEESFCLQISDDSHMPTYRDKEIVLVDPAVKARNGDFVLAEGHGLCELIDTQDGRFLASGDVKIPFDGDIIGVVVGSWMSRR